MGGVDYSPPPGFPNLSPGEFAVMMADGLTGKLLSKNHEWASFDEIHFELFDGLNEAKAFAMRELAENPLVEYVVLDHGGNCVDVYRDEKAVFAEAHRPKRKRTWWERLCGR